MRQLLPQLRSLGALRPGHLPLEPAQRALSVELRTVGHCPPGLSTELGNHLSIVDSGADLVLVLRGNGTLRELMELAGELGADRTPHLLLDLAYHHTFALGPLVVPGASACLACLAGRAGRRWGDPEPPARPRAGEQPQLVAALAGHAVRQIADGSLTLLERVVTFHLDELTTTTEHVLPSADCPHCPREPVGRVTLPWED